MFNKLSNREKILVVLALVISLSAIYYFYFYQPLNEEIVILEDKKSTKNKRLNIAQSYTKRLPEIKEEYRTIISDLESRGQYINKDSIDLLIDFREIAAENNLKLTLFKPKKNDDNISMSINIAGKFRDLTDLLAEFKTWNYWFEFRDINISKSADGVLLSMTALYHDRLVDQKLFNKGVETDD